MYVCSDVQVCPAVTAEWPMRPRADTDFIPESFRPNENILLSLKGIFAIVGRDSRTCLKKCDLRIASLVFRFRGLVPRPVRGKTSFRTNLSGVRMSPSVGQLGTPVSLHFFVRLTLLHGLHPIPSGVHWLSLPFGMLPHCFHAWPLTFACLHLAHQGYRKNCGFVLRVPLSSGGVSKPLVISIHMWTASKHCLLYYRCMYKYIYIYIYLCMYVCMCIYPQLRSGGSDAQPWPRPFPSATFRTLKKGSFKGSF